MAQGKNGQVLLRRPQGLRAAAPDRSRSRSSSTSSCARVRQLGFVNAEDVAKKVVALFEAGEFDVCTLFYSRFKSVIAQIPTAQQIIPLVIEARGNDKAAASDDYEPEEDELLASLLPRNLAVQIFRALLENNARSTARR